MRWDYHWDDIKESREYLKLAKKYNKLYLKSTSPIFTYKQENKYIDYEEVNIPNFDFIPSYDGMTDPFHLLHVHIPKCGGTTFERPLDIMKHWIMKTDGTGKSLISGKLSNKQLYALDVLDALLDSSENQYRCHMKSGDLVLALDSQVLHGRTCFSDYYKSKSVLANNATKLPLKRTMVRTWIKA